MDSPRPPESPGAPTQAPAGVSDAELDPLTPSAVPTSPVEAGASVAPAAPTAPPPAPIGRGEQRARALGERLRPVAAKAEDAAGVAVDLSVKGLSRLNALLRQRRAARRGGSGESGGSGAGGTGA